MEGSKSTLIFYGPFFEAKSGIKEQQQKQHETERGWREFLLFLKPPGAASTKVRKKETETREPLRKNQREFVTPGER